MTGARPRALLAMTEDTARQLFTPAATARLAALTELATAPWTGRFDPAELSGIELLITAWGVPPLDEAVLAAAPKLGAVFHAGGTIRRFCTDACWDRGLIIVTAADANAIPVAEFTLASIIYAGKRVFAASHGYRSRRANGWRDPGLLATASNHGRTVGLIGLSRIGRRVARLLEPFDLTVIASDPFAQQDSAPAELVPLDELLRRSDIVSLHAPLLPQTRHMLDAQRLSLMRDGATLINTARGGLVDTAALTLELQSGRICAILDVTDPEPLPASSPLLDLPNVQLTPHLAGSTGSELTRMGDLIVAELAAYVAGKPLRHQVVREELNRVA
ncbi:MAG TPA: hydroxyacid dehydrogenase [Candidatus Limnocylindrales bacterium]